MKFDPITNKDFVLNDKTIDYYDDNLSKISDAYQKQWTYNKLRERDVDPLTMDKQIGKWVENSVAAKQIDLDTLFQKGEITEQEKNAKIQENRVQEAQFVQDSLLKHLDLHDLGRVYETEEDRRLDPTIGTNDWYFVLPIKTGIGDVRGIGRTKSTFPQGSFRINRDVSNRDAGDNLREDTKEAAHWLNESVRTAKRQTLKAGHGVIEQLYNWHENLEADITIHWEKYAARGEGLSSFLWEWIKPGEEGEQPALDVVKEGYAQRWEDKLPESFYEKFDHPELKRLLLKERRDKMGIASTGLNILEVEKISDDYYDQARKGMEAWDVFQGLDLPNSFTSDVAQVMTEDVPFMGAFLAGRIIRGARTTRKYAPSKLIQSKKDEAVIRIKHKETTYNYDGTIKKQGLTGDALEAAVKRDTPFTEIGALTPLKLMDDFGFTERQAKKIFKRYELGNLDVSAMYVFKELDASLGFALGFTAWETREKELATQANYDVLIKKGLSHNQAMIEARKMAETRPFSLLSMGAGVAGAVFRPWGTAHKLITGQIGFSALSLMYKGADILGAKDKPWIKLRRKKAYLMASGMKRKEVEKLRQEGGLERLDEEIAKYDRAFKFGPFDNFFEMLHSVSERDQDFIKEVMNYNFDKLATIAKFMREDMGLKNFQFALDEIFTFGILGQLKHRLNNQKPFMTKNLFKRVYTPRIHDIRVRQQQILEGLGGYAEKIQKIINVGKDVPDEIKEFLEITKRHMDTMGSRLKQETVQVKNTLNDVLSEMDNKSATVIGNMKKNFEGGNSMWNYSLARQGTENFFTNLRKSVSETTTDMYNKLKINDDVEFDAKPFIDYLVDLRKENPLVTEEIFRILSTQQTGVTPALVTKLQRAVKARQFESFEPNAEGVASLRNIFEEAKQIELDGSPDDLTKTLASLDDELLKASTDGEKLDILKSAIKGIPEEILGDFLPSNFTFAEIRELSSMLGSQAWRYKDKPAAHHLYDAQIQLMNIMDDPKLLETGVITPEQSALGAELRKVKDTYREVMEVWGRPPFANIMKETATGGKTISWENAISHVFSDFKNLGANIEKLNLLLRGTPTGEFDDAGNMIYKSLTGEQLNEFTDLARYYIYQAMENGNFDHTHAAKILDELGKHGPVQRLGSGNSLTVFNNIFTPQIKEDLKEFITLKAPSFGTIENETKRLVSSLQDELKDIFGTKMTALERSFLQKLSTWSDVSTEDMLKFFMGEGAQRSVQATGDVSDESLAHVTFGAMSARLQNISKTEAAGFLPVWKNGRMESLGGDEIFASPYEIIKKMANNFEGPEGTRIKAIFANVLQNYFMNQVIKKGYTRSVKDINERGLGLVDDLFMDLLDRTKQIREDLFDPRVNEMLEGLDRGVMILREGAARMGDNLPFEVATQMAQSSVLSRIYAIQRGVISMRWVLGEAGLREMQLAQVRVTKELLDNADMTQVAISMMNNEVPRVLRRGNWGRAIRQVAYLSFANPDHIARIMTEEEADYLVKTGQIHEETLDRVLKHKNRKKRLSEMNEAEKAELKQIEKQLKKASRQYEKFEKPSRATMERQAAPR